MNQLLSVPSMFNIEPFGGQWFHWNQIEECFWPGKGRRPEKVNPQLASVRNSSGVYLLAWSMPAPELVSPLASQIQYIGQTNCFHGRMAQFATSAGLWGKRDNGHSAGWRWPEGKRENLFVAFFPIIEGLSPHLASGLCHWLEALALEAYRINNNELPMINRDYKEASFPVA